MTLKDRYQNMKKDNAPSSKRFYQVFLGICLLAFYVYLVYLGWNNIISKIFNLSSLTYIQTGGMLVWILLIKSWLKVGEQV